MDTIVKFKIELFIHLKSFGSLDSWPAILPKTPNNNKMLADIHCRYFSVVNWNGLSYHSFMAFY